MLQMPQGPIPCSRNISAYGPAGDGGQVCLSYIHPQTHQLQSKIPTHPP